LHRTTIIRLTSNDANGFVLALAEQVERREPCRRVPLIVKASDSDVCGFIECIADLEMPYRRAFDLIGNRSAVTTSTTGTDADAAARSASAHGDLFDLYSRNHLSGSAQALQRLSALRCKAKPQGYGPVDSHHGPVIQTTDDLPDLATSDGSDLVDHICETERSPFEFVGSTVNRNNGASTMVLVTGATATLECVSLNRSD